MKQKIKNPDQQSQVKKENIQCKDHKQTGLIPHNILFLQQTIGNQAVSGLLSENIPKQRIQKKQNTSGLPDTLKDGIEHLCGFSLDDVKVYRNSPKPAEVNALAYTQGREIYLGPGQEKHLAHEAWHVVQQKQGRVIPTGNVAGLPLNDSRTLEVEADIMGRKALLHKTQTESNKNNLLQTKSLHQSYTILQRVMADRARNVTQAEAGELNGKTCWDAVVFFLVLYGILPPRYADWTGNRNQAEAHLVNMNDTPVFNPNIPADNVVGVFRNSHQGIILSHVMLSLGGGDCIGTNNGCIGGRPDWSIQDLNQLFTWPGGNQDPTLNSENNEVRYIRCRTIANVVPHFP